MKTRKIFCFLFIILSVNAFAINANNVQVDIGVNLGEKNGTGLVVAVKYFVINDFAVEFFLGGSMHSFGVGLEAAYFPSFWDYWVYPNVGLSYSIAAFNKIVTKQILLNFDLGVNLPRFYVPTLLSQDSDKQFLSALYVEVGGSKIIYNEGAPEQKEIAGFLISNNLELGFRQGKW